MPRVLKDFYREVPPDLSRHFKMVTARRRDTPSGVIMNLLSIDHAATLTRALRRFHAILQAVEGFVLDDCGGDGNHVYVGASFFGGSILHLSANQPTRIVFASVEEYWWAIDKAIYEGRSIEALHPRLSPLAPRQESLNETIRHHFKMEEDASVICALLPSSALTDQILMRRLIKDQDGRLGEAIALEIGKRPAPNLRSLAEFCTQQGHSGTVMAGIRALEAISGGRTPEADGPECPRRD